MKKFFYFSLLFIISCGTPTESNEDVDCLGIVDGTASLDACGVCQGDGFNVNDFGSCDCLLDGDVYADCQGVCGGSAITDCAGECGGFSLEDNCGVCDNDFNNDCHVNNYQIGHKLHIDHQNLEFEYCYPSELSSENDKFTFSDYFGKIFMIEMSATW
tara:strand:- start:349 stop:822 length:474 start_codon:yes stop_codon:yes gene_type:complete